MANAFTYQVLKDTTEHVVIKLTGKFDGSGDENNGHRIQANTFYGALDANNVPLNSALSVSNTPLSYYNTSIHRVWYDCVNPQSADVELFWYQSDTGNTVTALFMSGTYEYDGAGNFITLPNAAKGMPGCNGDLGIKTRGMQANNSYTIIVELRKDNAMYQRGQFNDPAAFNYGDYSIRP